MRDNTDNEKDRERGRNKEEIKAREKLCETCVRRVCKNNKLDKNIFEEKKVLF